MGQATLVEEQIADGKRLIDQLIEKGIPIVAACWVKESENGRWYLYLVTPLVGEDGAKRPAYRRTNDVLRRMPRPFGIGLFDKKVVGPTSPIGEAVMSLQRGYFGRSPIHWGADHLGEVSIEEAYIYPPRWIFHFEYEQQGDTNQWNASAEGKCDRASPNELWRDGEARLERQGKKVVVRVRCDEAIVGNDAAIAEELANEEFQKQLPGQKIKYPCDEPQS